MGVVRAHRRSLAAATSIAIVAAIGWAQLGPTPASGAADCASLGQAAHFVAFSHGDINASPPGGENITGRIAAAGDVTLGGPGGGGGVFVSGAAGDAAPTVIAGHNLSAGRSGAGGTLSGGATYGNAVSVASNFFVNPAATKLPAPFSFDDEFTSLRTLSASLADHPQSGGATVNLNPSSHALELTGTADGLNVFAVSAAQLTQAAGVTIKLTKAGATALINVTSDTVLTVSLQYMNLSGISAANVAWNFPLATSLTISGPEAWEGLALAPNAKVTMDSNGQFNGQVIAASIPAASRTLTKVAFTGCLPPPPPPSPPDESLTLTALCVNADGDLAMRLRNTGDLARTGTWVDQGAGGTDFGQFAVPAHHDLFFDVDNPTAHSVIAATSGQTTVTAPGTAAPCQGQITVRLVTVGPAPAGATWDVGLHAGTGAPQRIGLGSGDEQTVTVPGGYVPGAALIDQVIGGVAYTVTVADTLGGTATVSLNPIEILDGQHEIVTVTIAFEEPGVEPGPEPGPGPGPEVPSVPEQPTLPPGAPEPLPGPPLGSSSLGTDLAITYAITPRRVRVGGVINLVTRVRNLGVRPAVGVVAREIPQYHPAQANSVAQVLAVTTTRGRCTNRRPVHCSLGTLNPGASVTIRGRARLLVAGALRGIVVVSSETPERNTANNIAIALVTAFAPTPHIAAAIGAPAVVHVAQRVRYRVTVRGGGKAGADSVRLCTRPPATLIAVHAPGTIGYRGALCVTTGHLAAGRSLSFAVSGLASARGHLFPTAKATATDVARPARASTRVLVLGPRVACAATARSAAAPGPPTARAAC
jgi:choice-of-anchor A domain-containing protein